MPQAVRDSVSHPRADRRRRRATTPIVALAAMVVATSCAMAPTSNGAWGGDVTVLDEIVVDVDGRSVRATGARRFVDVVACPGGGTQRLQFVVGSTGDGADFVLAKPLGRWSGSLVTFVHGYVDPARPVGYWDDPPTSTEALWEAWSASDGDFASGVADALTVTTCAIPGPFLPAKPAFAFAASSFSSNGYAVEEGTRDTHPLPTLFERTLGTVERTFLAGASLGGLIAVRIADMYPGRYDGTLPVCAPLAGSLAQFAYLGNLDLAFRWVYPGIFPESDPATPLGLPYGDPAHPTSPSVEDTVVNRIVAAVTADPSGLARLAAMTVEVAGLTAPIVQADPNDSSTVLAAVLQAYGLIAVGREEANVRGGGSPYDNRTFVFREGDSILNVPRYAGEPRALAYYAAFHQPLGRPGTPTIALHNLFDGLVPSWHTVAYAALTDLVGSDDMVRATLVPDPSSPQLGSDAPAFGHCDFALEAVAALAALATWAETGSPPTFATASVGRATE